MAGLIKQIPKPLLEDISKNHCIPIIGAGFSLNAVLPDNEEMPSWSDLGKIFAKQMDGYNCINPIEAISTYCYEYSRVKAVELLRAKLFVDEARPGFVHDAFSDLKFDPVITTNFDFLLERACANNNIYCVPVIGAEQLSISMPKDLIRIIKFHGDLNHPDKLVLTEEDYDTFLDKNPIMATYIANLLITRTPLFIGYSLDDPDFRGIWQIIISRLGSMKRNAYALAVGMDKYTQRKYERRGVKVINLKGQKKNYKKILESFFKELKDFLDNKITRDSTFSDITSKAELLLPPEIETGLCFFSVPFNLLSFYRENIFPFFENNGFTPIIAEDMVTPGDNISQKVSMLIERSDLIYIDIDKSNITNIQHELGYSIAKGKKPIIVIEEGIEMYSIKNIEVMKRPKINSAKIYDFINKLIIKVENLSKDKAILSEDPIRLLKKKEYRAAVIIAFSYLENELRKKFKSSIKNNQRPPSLYQLIFKKSVNLESINDKDILDLRVWLNIRNELVHTGRKITKKKADIIVYGILEIVKKINNESK